VERGEFTWVNAFCIAVSCNPSLSDKIHSNPAALKTILYLSISLFVYLFMYDLWYTSSNDGVISVEWTEMAVEGIGSRLTLRSMPGQHLKELYSKDWENAKKYRGQKWASVYQAQLLNASLVVRHSRCQNVTVFYIYFLFISRRCYLQRHFTKLWTTTDGIYTAEQTSVPWNCLNCFSFVHNQDCICCQFSLYRLDSTVTCEQQKGSTDR
jgi:hypothetical protein